MEMGWDLAKASVNSKAIGLGHPIEASRHPFLVTLLHNVQRRKCQGRHVSPQYGGGMGVAMAFERD